MAKKETSEWKQFNFCNRQFLWRVRKFTFQADDLNVRKWQKLLFLDVRFWHPKVGSYFFWEIGAGVMLIVVHRVIANPRIFWELFNDCIRNKCNILTELFKLWHMYFVLNYPSITASHDPHCTESMYHLENLSL